MSMFTIHFNVAQLRSAKDAESVGDKLRARFDDIDPESMSVSEIAFLISSIDEMMKAVKVFREDLDTLYAHAFKAEENIEEAMINLTMKDEDQDIWF